MHETPADVRWPSFAGGSQPEGFVADITPELAELKRKVARELNIVPKLLPKRTAEIHFCDSNGTVPTVTVVRGFDQAPLSFGARALAEPDWLVAQLRPLAPPRDKSEEWDVRFRTTVLELPVFVPSHAVHTQHNCPGQVRSYTRALLAHVTALMERTQVSFRGVCDSLRELSLTLGYGHQHQLDARLLGDAWFQRELLLRCQAAELPLPPADFAAAQNPNWAHNAAQNGEWAQEAAFPVLKRHFRRANALHHDSRCTRRGNCKLLVMDGNAKVWRRTCSQRFRFYDIRTPHARVALALVHTSTHTPASAQFPATDGCIAAAPSVPFVASMTA